MYKNMDYLSTEIPIPDLDLGAALACPIGVTRCSLTLVTDALGKRPSPLAGDVYEARIAGDLVEHGQDPLRFRQKAAVQIRFELQQGVVNSQAVVFHAARNQVHVLLLTSQPLKN